MAIKRREENLEQEEIEGGEINLIPYLDIVTNLMLFLLASVSAGIILGQINTTLPDRAPPAAAQATPPATDPNEQPLQLVVSVQRDQIVLWSLGGVEGTLAEPKARIARTGKLGEACDSGAMCESNECAPATKTCAASTSPPGVVFDYRALNAALVEIASRRYLGKNRKIQTYRAFLNVDFAVPYGTVISVMSAMRCKMPEVGKSSDRCLLPTDDEALKKAEKPVDDIGRLYDTDRAAYDPGTMALFQDIAFLQFE
jgi:biopolymer transport protein ExbD